MRASVWEIVARKGRAALLYLGQGDVKLAVLVLGRQLAGVNVVRQPHGARDLAVKTGRRRNRIDACRWRWRGGKKNTIFRGGKEDLSCRLKLGSFFSSLHFRSPVMTRLPASSTFSCGRRENVYIVRLSNKKKALLRWPQCM